MIAIYSRCHCLLLQYLWAVAGDGGVAEAGEEEEGVVGHQDDDVTTATSMSRHTHTSIMYHVIF